MPRSKAANAQRRDARRAKILDAARLTFARRGLTATMDDVAAEANISHGLAYRYFPSKDTLFQALVEEALEAAPTGLQPLEEVSVTADERLILLISQLVQNRRQRPEFYLLLDHVRNSPSTKAKLRDQLRGRKKAFLGLLRSLIVEGQKSGKVHPGNPDGLVMAVSAFLEGMSQLAIHESEDFRKHFPEPEVILRVLIPKSEKSPRRVKR